MRLAAVCLIALSPILAAQTPTAPAAAVPTYRLNYTVSESDNGKRIGVQHFSLTLTPGANSGSLKLGSKVPLATGSYSGGNNPIQTQFTFIDVGLNINAHLTPAPGGAILLESKVEQSSVTETVSVSDIREPVIRQAVLQNTAELIPGKPVMLGSLDTPGSTRHLDIEVVLEPVK